MAGDSPVKKQKYSQASKIDGKQETEEKKTAVSLSTLFSTADYNEKVLMAVGSIVTIPAAASMPMFIVYFGKVMDGLNDSTSITDAVNEFSLIFVIVGAVNLVVCSIYVWCWSLAGERQALKIKNLYVQAILRQDIGWFDEHPAGQLPSLVTLSMGQVQDGIGRKIPDIIMYGLGGLGDIIAAFYLNPILSLILLCCLPLIGISVALLTKVMSAAVVEGQSHYGEAGAVANEVLGGIRTVASLCAEVTEMSRYSKFLILAEKAGIKKSLQSGFGQGFMFFCFFLSYALAFWYGIKQVSDDLNDDCQENCATGGSVISAIFGVIFGSMMLGQTAPGLTALGTARAAAVSIFETINRKPAIDAFSEEGLRPSSAKGYLTFDKVKFSYPARPDDIVYENISLDIPVGETLALVGPSGGGKSTMTKLILRFYDPTSGSIRLDGNDIKDINIGWYRQQIGYVGQEPVLFAGSIRDNICNGKFGATDQEIIDAAKAANAHDFIKGFPNGYATDVGEGGLQLSGGQKQRVAIARAIVKDPSILLLDEATSALDNESEKVVQKALDRLHQLKRRTTITIAHRLSTIQRSDRIAVIANKGVAELGNHNELLALNGIYAQLCRLQLGDDDSNDYLMRRESSYRESFLKRNRSQSSKVRMNELSSNPLKDKAEEERPLAPMSRIWALAKDDTHYIAMGLLGALMAGSIFPVEGVLLAYLQDVFYFDDTNRMKEEGNKYIIGFVGASFGAILGYVFLYLGFGTASERMTRRLREMSFRALLRHDVSWFDSESNATGQLTSNLEKDATAMALATGTALGYKVQLAMTLIVAIVIGIVACWKIGLVSLGLIPLIGVAGIVHMAMITGGYGDNEGLDGGASASSILGAALNAVSTVHAFNMQQNFCERYSNALKVTTKERKKRALVAATSFGYSQGITFWVFALLFWYGAMLVKDEEFTFLQFYMSMFTIILGAFGIGQINADMDAQKKGQEAAARVFALCDTEFNIDPLSEAGAKPPKVSGRLQFENIVFSYPSRPDQFIYGGPSAPDGFSLNINAGETVALVGQSGSGKSTCIGLLLRFYDVMSGKISLDGRDIREYNVHSLRYLIGYVGQEPVLFAESIRENIIKGYPAATDKMIEDAARAANAHDFIMSFPDGYDTDVGEKSALLSGGQKQRIAIARAIIKNPAILLLDEATSALDNESERQVQAALDQLQEIEKRTTLIVAHRLSTIRHADKIAVIGDGCVKELGTHDELLKIPQGIYQKLYTNQNKN